MKTVHEIASLIGGTVHGDAEIEIHTVGSLDRAGAGSGCGFVGRWRKPVDGRAPAGAWPTCRRGP